MADETPSENAEPLQSDDLAAVERLRDAFAKLKAEDGQGHQVGPAWAVLEES